MGLYEYLALSDEEQWNEIWDKGKFLTNFKSIDCSYSLYSLHNFFIEVELDPLNDTIIAKHIFKRGARMDKYLLDIDLSI